jgi:hypothetical protein
MPPRTVATGGPGRLARRVALPRRVRADGARRTDRHRLSRDRTWSFASGCQHSRWRMGGAIVASDPQELLPSGAPDVRSVLLHADETTIHDTIAPVESPRLHKGGDSLPRITMPMGRPRFAEPHLDECPGRWLRWPTLVNSLARPTTCQRARQRTPTSQAAGPFDRPWSRSFVTLIRRHGHLRVRRPDGITMVRVSPRICKLGGSNLLPRTCSISGQTAHRCSGPVIARSIRW